MQMDSSTETSTLSALDRSSPVDCRRHMGPGEVGRVPMRFCKDKPSADQAATTSPTSLRSGVHRRQAAGSQEAFSKVRSGTFGILALLRKALREA